MAQVINRDYVIARIAMARTEALDATNTLDEVLVIMSDPAGNDDEDGTDRVGALEAAVGALDTASALARAALATFGDIDASEGEPELPEEEETEDDG